MKFLVEFSFEELDLLSATLSGAGARHDHREWLDQIAAVPVHKAIFQKIEDVLAAPDNKLTRMRSVYDAVLGWRRYVMLVAAEPRTRDMLVVVDAAIAADVGPVPPGQSESP